MTIRDMHYDFKMKFNKLDSQKNRNLRIPEIDWVLNSAVNLFVALIAEPRYRTRLNLGFEINQRTIDDIRSIVVQGTPIIPVNGIIALPQNYRHWVKGTASVTKGTCNSTARVFPKQHDDMFEESPFDNSSFEWRQVNALFESLGLRVFADDFTINNVSITYIRKMAYMHNAQDFGSITGEGSYKLPSGVVLTGSVNCELPDQGNVHSEVVDIAVMLASAGVQTSDYQVKLSKLNINQII